MRRILLFLFLLGCKPFFGETIFTAQTCTDNLTIECTQGSILIRDAYRRSGKDCTTPSGVFSYNLPLVTQAWLECNLKKKCQIADKNNRPDSYFAVHYDCVDDVALSRSVIDICDNRAISAKEGYIHSPGFPLRKCLNKNETPCTCTATPNQRLLEPVTVYARLNPTDVLDLTIDTFRNRFTSTRNYYRAIWQPQTVLKAEFRTSWAGSWNGAFVIHYKTDKAFQLVCGRNHAAANTCPSSPLATTASTKTTPPLTTTQPTIKQTTTTTIQQTTTTVVTKPPTSTVHVGTTTKTLTPTTTTKRTAIVTKPPTSTVGTTTKTPIPTTTSKKPPATSLVPTTPSSSAKDPTSTAGTTTTVTGPHGGGGPGAGWNVTGTRSPDRHWEGLGLSDTAILIITMLFVPVVILIVILAIVCLILYCKRRKRRPRKLRAYRIPDTRREYISTGHSGSLRRPDEIGVGFDSPATFPRQGGHRPADTVYDGRVEVGWMTYGEAGIGSIHDNHLVYGGPDEIYVTRLHKEL